jgi:hypothetical protein
MSRSIPEDVLRGIAEALEIHAPHLLPKIYHLMRGGLADGPTGNRGSPICGKLTTTISWEDEGEPILRALESIEQDHGYQTLFAGRQINYLVGSWRQFSEPLQLPPQS